ncbi:hypothetical protein ACHAXT_006278 [Thalassiosira profunda]
MAPATPRADSLASLTAAGGDGAGATASPGRPVPRSSRKKLRHKVSSLEFLADTGDASASPPRREPAKNKSPAKSPGRSQKLVEEGLAFVAGGSYNAAAATDAPSRGGRKRQMSPRSKSKLEDLAEDAESSDDEKARGEIGADRPTPKTQRAVNAQARKQSPKVSYSPLDYRPENGTDAAKPDAASQMLESYAEKWAKPSPKQKRGEVMERDEPSESSSQDVADVQEKDDKSSVVSTSSNSEDDDEADDGKSDLPGKGREPDLELEYGRLAFMKKELEHKMNLHKLDAAQVNPWTCPPPVGGSEASPAAKTGAGEKLGSGDLQLVRAQSRPSRGDVAFGEMAFQKMMAERRSGQSHGGGVREGYGRDRGESMLTSRPSSKSRPKKKRKRRVVETITRVIHEESEEEGSSSTGGRGGPHRYYLGHQPEAHRYLGGRKSYPGEEDESYDSRGKSYEKGPNVDGRRMRQSSSPSKERGSPGRQKSSPAGKKRKQGKSANNRGRSQPSMLEALD